MTGYSQTANSELYFSNSIRAYSRLMQAKSAINRGIYAFRVHFILHLRSARLPPSLCWVQDRPLLDPVSKPNCCSTRCLVLTAFHFCLADITGKERLQSNGLFPLSLRQDCSDFVHIRIPCLNIALPFGQTPISLYLKQT